MSSKNKNRGAMERKKTVDMTKEEYIGNYVGKRMKGNKLPYGMAYINLCIEYEEIAEKYWERMMRKRLKETS